MNFGARNGDSQVFPFRLGKTRNTIRWCQERTRMAYKGFDLTGKVSLITGGNGGIGFGMADALAEAGADVCIGAPTPGRMQTPPSS